jgi:hypothetical protein
VFDLFLTFFFRSLGGAGKGGGGGEGGGADDDVFLGSLHVRGCSFGN